MSDDSMPRKSNIALLETSNPLDVTPQDLEDLAELLEAAEPHGSMLVSGPMVRVAPLNTRICE
jgi:hypothetical protein